MKYINFTLLLAISCIVIFLSGFFWIGSKENAEQLLENPIQSFVLRFIGFVSIGIIMFLLVVVVNLLLMKFTKYNINLKKLIWLSFIIIIISSLIGTSIFFVFM
jgi:hypothetical protein